MKEKYKFEGTMMDERLIGEYKDEIKYELADSLGIELAPDAVVGISKKAYFMEKWGRNTFIVFASHSLFLTYVIKVIMLPFGYDINNIETVFIYLFSCLVTYAISFVLGEIISRNAS